MPINFVQLLQESWNFTRNQPRFTIIALGLLVAMQLVVTLFLPNISLEAQNTLGALSAVLLGVISIYFSTLIILNIKQISEGHYRAFSQNIVPALSKLFPAIGVYIVMSFPISLGMASVIFTKGQGEGSVISIPLMIFGLFIFVRLSLSLFAMLIENLSAWQAVKFTWNFTKGKFFPLSAYCFLAHIFPSLIISLFSRLGNNIAMVVGSLVISAFFSYFMTILGFRFYQTLRLQSQG